MGMRNLLVVMVAVFLVSACGDDGTPIDPVDGGIVEQVDPVQQCDELADLYVAAIYSCGCWDDNAGPAADYYAARCERNLTAYPSPVMQQARDSLAVFECVPNEVCISWPRDDGRVLFNAMASWPAPAAVTRD